MNPIRLAWGIASFAIGLVTDEIAWHTCKRPHLDERVPPVECCGICPDKCRLRDA